MTDASPARRLPWGLALFALLFAVLMAAGALVTPPAVRAENTPNQFNADIARARLARILGDEAPHPIDSARQDQTRAALIAEIEAMGLAPEVRETFACRPHPNNPVIDCMNARNIVFSIGPEGGPTIIAASHYDSVPAAPGASDDGVGVAAWLEIARVLSHEDLTRRIQFVITDGEEIALMGAHIFQTQDPDFANAEALINLEARGMRGPALFFETNQPNADAIFAFARAPGGMANSVMADVYEILPNNTDVTEFRRDGLDIVNIALLDGLENYHTPQDSLASQDPRSLQHMGDVALHVTRTLATRPDIGDQTEMVYTDLAGKSFVSAPGWIVQIVLGLSALVALFAFWRTGAAGRWRAFGLSPLALVIAGVGAFVVGYAFSAMRGGLEYWFAHPEATRAWAILLALVAIAKAQFLLRAPNAAQAGAASTFWFTGLGFALTLVTPGISILFAIPALFFAIGALIAFFWPHAQRIGAGIAAALTLLVWAPIFYLVEVALGYGMPYANVFVAVLIALPWIGSILGVQERTRWLAPTLVLGGAAAAAIAWAAFVPSYSPTKPLSINVNYVSDGVAVEGRIAAGSARRALPPALAAAAPFEPTTILPGDRLPQWAAPAPFEQVARPVLDQPSVATEGETRIWRATLRANGAYRISLRIPRDAQPVSATVRGVETRFDQTGGAGDFVTLACQGRSCDGADIAIRFTGDALWHLIGQYPVTTTESSRAVIAQRGPAATPFQFGDSIVTIDPVPMPD